MVAACRTVEGRLPHSLHCYFILPGDPQVPIIYEVERLRDGKSYSPAGSPRSSTAMRSSRSWCRFTSRNRARSITRTRCRTFRARKSSPPRRWRNSRCFAKCRTSSAVLRIRPPDRTSAGRTRPLFRPEDRRRPHPCLDSHRGQATRRPGAAYVRAGLCVGFLAARCSLWRVTAARCSTSG